MWCDPPSIPSADVIQPIQSNWPKQLSFVYQPGVGLYDQKKNDIDQDLRITSTTKDVDERIQSLECSPVSSTFTSDVDHRSSSPSTKPSNLYKSYLRRQNEQDSLPIRQKLVTSDKNRQSPPRNNHHIKVIDDNISPNQENNQKRKFDQDISSIKKLRHSSSDTPKSTDTLTLSSSNENLKCEKNLLDEELNRQKAKLITTSQQFSPIKLPPKSNERLHLPPIIKNFFYDSAEKKGSNSDAVDLVNKRRKSDEDEYLISKIFFYLTHLPELILFNRLPETRIFHLTTSDIPMVKRSSSENRKPEIISTEKIPSQGLLLCPKEESIKKKKKKKITPASTALLDDDSVLDSILFNEMQSVQQQWQQFLILTMEKEFHINPSDGKKKLKLNKFQRTNEFLLSYENLYHFEGMKHWYPTSR